MQKGGIHGKNNLTPSVSNQTPRRIDEVVLNALAFSTLLSSQGTDALRRSALAVSGGLSFSLQQKAYWVDSRPPNRFFGFQVSP
jgi:hypothetical protein